MKKICLCVLLVVAGFSDRSQAAVLITGFGSADLNPLNPSTDFISPWTGTQNNTSVSVSNVSNQSGGIASVLSTPINISNNTTYLSLTGLLTGSAPLTNTFQLKLYDSNYNSVSYDFNWSGFSNSTTTETMPIATTSGVFDGTVSAYGLNLFGGSGDTVSFTFDDLEAIPEPSTWALLVFGLAGIAFILFRRRLSVRP